MQNGIHPDGRRWTGPVILRGEEISGEEVHPVQTVQGGTLRSKDAQTRHERTEEPEATHEQPACNQNLIIIPRHKTLD